MAKKLVLVLCILGTFAGCGRVSESRLNPFNWFGGSQSAEVAVNPTSLAAQNLISQVVSLRVEQVPGGAILRATGLPTRQGYFDGDLVPLGTEVAQNGVLSYEFRIEQPYTDTRVGTQQSREVIVARFLSEQTLSGVGQIRVSGSANALSVRR